MEASKETPMDEIQWRSPEMVQQMPGGIHTNTGKYCFLHYFAGSPFFDQTSNNAVLTTQAMSNPSLGHLLSTRVAFEGRLRAMQGLEFMVTHDPSEGDTKLVHSGVWVIRKQIRRKGEVTGLSSYYVVGENVYMAPTLANIISSRILSAATSINQLVTTATSLPSFTPSSGYSYIPPISKQPTLPASFHNTQTSKESTPLPVDTQEGQKARTSTGPKPQENSNQRDARMFAEAWDLAIRYGNDFMDETPMTGEPGAFKLAKVKDLALPSITSATPAPQPFKPAPKKAPPIKTDLPPEKEKKSTPGTAKSPITPGTAKEKKARRKSKAAGIATPKEAASKPSTPAAG
ncbi:uncharacterized protein KY384_003507 [Bacidia gigantensis]|uniref:uncharacterized protein n=1 Tax=Bacidia gigantensis TaxID=2732470 RepID=UPI001D0440A2|nr:uncharacterized protein KY384_003507 [Bacidia gigantensis]KAG8531871.1 hypothetical protein KY384_003507 [Bacidia gigantensis]